MIFEDVKQGGQDWLDMRRRFITATDSPVILGLSHFKTMSELYDEKIGLLTPDPPNDKMLLGQKLEPEARDLFNRELKLDCEPVVIRSSDQEWMMASLDGMSSDHKHILEIKCSKFCYDNAREGIISDQYKCQMQHQMFCADVDHCFFFAYYKGSYSSIRFDRDDCFIDYMIPRLYDFWKCLNNLEFPGGYNEDRLVKNG